MQKYNLITGNQTIKTQIGASILSTKCCSQNYKQDSRFLNNTTVVTGSTIDMTYSILILECTKPSLSIIVAAQTAN